MKREKTTFFSFSQRDLWMRQLKLLLVFLFNWWSQEAGHGHMERLVERYQTRSYINPNTSVK
jgi:hypothetical protein